MKKLILLMIVFGVVTSSVSAFHSDIVGVFNEPAQVMFAGDEDMDPVPA